MKKLLGNNAGFTLIEIMVVIVILGMLAVLVGPKIIGQTDDAKLADAKQKMLDYQAKLSQVNAQGKLEDPNYWYNLLSNDATGVINCIDQIQ